jgi:hypothetical protein
VAAPRIVRGWDEYDIRRREAVFDGLVTRAVRMSLRALTADLRPLVAAYRPQLTLGETGTVAATWQAYVAGELYPYLVQTFVDAAGDVARDAETAAGATLPTVGYSYAADCLSSATNRLWNLGDQVWNQVRDQLAVGYDSGESIGQLAARIRDVSDLTEAKALAVARTEVASAVNQGTLYQMLIAGFTDQECEKGWLATEDERTRPAHVQADGQWVGVLQPFIVGGEGLQCPGDPTGRPDNIINCRCTLQFRFPDDNEPTTAAGQPRDAYGRFVRASAAPAGLDEFRWIEDEHPRLPDGEFTDKFDWLSFADADQMHDDMQRGRPWTGAQFEALTDYAHESYVPINAYLRGQMYPGDKPAPRTLAQVDAIRGAMRPTTRDLKVQRGLYANAFEGVKTAGDLEKMVGRTFEERGFLSTTIDPKFLKSTKTKRTDPIVTLELDVPAGTSAAYLAAGQSHQHPGLGAERELLLDAGTRFVITGVEERAVDGRDQFVVLARVIPNAPAETKRKLHLPWTRGGAA